MPTTAGLLPEQSPPEYDPDTGRIDIRHAGPVCNALASESARMILATVADDPKPASAVAETVETSTQNATYHINILQEADLLTVVDTRYSEKGREMDIYTATYGSVVLTVGTTI